MIAMLELKIFPVTKSMSRKNDEKKVSYVTLFLTCFIILKMTMITNTTNELIVNRSRKREK